MLSAELMLVLRDEISADPAGLGYADHLPDSPGIVADLINNVKTDTMLGPLRTTTAKAWAAHGPYARIVDASADVTHACRASCLVIRDSFACGDPIHIEDPGLQAMLAKWVEHGVATQAEVDALYQLATVPASRAEKLGLDFVTAYDITAARAIQ